MITKTKTIKINATQVWDVLASHLFAVGAVPKDYDISEMSSFMLTFAKTPYYEIVLTLVKEEN
jgi:hypothetical protein